MLRRKKALSPEDIERLVGGDSDETGTAKPVKVSFLSRLRFGRAVGEERSTAPPPDRSGISTTPATPRPLPAPRLQPTPSGPDLDDERPSTTVDEPESAESPVSGEAEVEPQARGPLQRVDEITSFEIIEEPTDPAGASDVVDAAESEPQPDTSDRKKPIRPIRAEDSVWERYQKEGPGTK